MFILEINPVLNATEIAVAIVIRYGRDFCGPKTEIVWVPVSRSSPSLDQGLEEILAS